MTDLPTLIFRTVGAWGGGKGADLTALEVDSNFWNLLQYVLGIEVNEPTQITSISIVGTNTLRVTMEDGQTFDNPIPYATMTWRDEWSDGESYNPLDLFTTNDGLYLVLQEHETPTGDPFNPDAGNMQGPFAVRIMAYPTDYDLGFCVPGKPGRGLFVGDAVGSFRATRPFYIPAFADGSVGGLEEGSDIEMVFPIYKNDEEIGSFTVGEDVSESSESSSASESESEGPLPPQVGEFTFSVLQQFAPGDRLRILRPATLSEVARELTITMKAVRGLAE